MALSAVSSFQKTSLFSQGKGVVEGGFPSASACRIVGVTPRQIQYWDEIGLMKPSASAAAGRGSRRRYSFLDLLRLSVVRALIERGLKPQNIRRSLAALHDARPKVLDPLAQLKLVTDGERLFLVTNDRRQILDVLERQFVFSIALGPLVRELRGRAERLLLGARTTTRRPPLVAHRARRRLETERAGRQAQA